MIADAATCRTPPVREDALTAIAPLVIGSQAVREALCRAAW